MDGLIATAKGVMSTPTGATLSGVSQIAQSEAGQDGSRNHPNSLLTLTEDHRLAFA